MTCKICSFETNLWEDSRFSQYYHYCPQCECVFLDPLFYTSKEAEKKVYENHHNTLENRGYVQMFEGFLDYFWDKLTCQENALDFGSGPTPVLSYLLQNRHVKVDCYDKFYQPIEIFENRTYDFITSTEVFEHLEAPLETLRFLKNHLRPGGIIAIMTLFHSNDYRQFLTWWYKRDTTHITFFTPKTIRTMAEKCGFDVIKEDGKRIAVLKKR